MLWITPLSLLLNVIEIGWSGTADSVSGSNTKLTVPAGLLAAIASSWAPSTGSPPPPPVLFSSTQAVNSASSTTRTGTIIRACSPPHSCEHWRRKFASPS